jgi:ATP-dependent Clp protease ATP-binding subunit ClpA
MPTKRILLNATALKIYNQALALASRFFHDKQPCMTPDLVFLAFLHEDSPVYRSLERTLKLLQPAFDRIAVEQKICSAYLRRNQDTARGQSEQLFHYAKQSAAARGEEIINEYDLFRSLFAVQDNCVMAAVIEMGVSRSGLVEAINALPIDAVTDQQAAEFQVCTRVPETKGNAKVPGLDTLLEGGVRHLTELARQEQLEKIWFRDVEILDASEILCRRTQRNLLVVGEPGVGKTAIIQGMAQKIISETCPERLKGKEIVELNLAFLLDGAAKQGEFEKSVQQWILACAQSENIILFFDEADRLFGQGNRSAALVAPLLQSALSQRKLQIIGALSQKMFHVLNDSSLLEQFSVIVVRPLRKEKVIELLTQLAPQLQENHHIAIGDSAVRATVELAGKFLSNGSFPGKAIHLLNRCAARLSAEAGSRDRRMIPTIGRQDLAEVVSEMTGIEVIKILTASVANLD